MVTETHQHLKITFTDLLTTAEQFFMLFTICIRNSNATAERNKPSTLRLDFVIVWHKEGQTVTP
jgi:hypothetical protein